jgi:DNA-binding GntR family transcriptional regulator
VTDRFLTKSDLAYSQLRDSIMSGALPAGSALNQETLAHSLGISTTPLREALRRLKAEGLVQLDAHRDARVAPLNLEEARDLLEVRRSLDPLAAGLAALRRTKEDIDVLRRTVEDLRPLPGDAADTDLRAHRRFHTAVYTASHNDLLIGMLDGLWDKADRYRRLGLRTPRDQASMDRKAEEHAALVDLIVAGDSEGATQVMHDHIETSLGVEALRRLGEVDLNML